MAPSLAVVRRVPVVALLVAACCPALTASAVAAPPPRNLGNGLGRLLAPPPARSGFQATQAPLAIRDGRGRVLVDVVADAGASLSAVRARGEAAGLAVDTTSRAGHALEGYVALDDVAALAAVPGVASVSQALRPFTKVGAATTQGVHAERVDRVRSGIDGSGVTVGALSDSFDTATLTADGAPLTIHAADDVASGDLPPDVTVLEDDASGAGVDEGRAMLQIVHDIAPGARECFATAETGDLGFAENIRRLADDDGPCGADILVDDVGYFDEPFFSRGPISDAVDEVAAQGVHYFSSAGNGSSQQAYEAPLRLVSGPDATAGTNLKLANVNPSLYAGGFEDFDPGPGVDVAQNLALGRVNGAAGTGVLDLQWDDPVGVGKTTTDLNALFFDASGRFITALADANVQSGKPFEIGGLRGAGPLQLVIAKANPDQGEATRLRYQLFDGFQYDEYVQPLAPSIFGHPLARGATAVAAYDAFRPLLPDDYSSVGGELPILFDSAGDRLPAPDVRRAPQLAATDGGNTTFFTTDSVLDDDTQPNFFGSSAAAPHAAAIAALALQAAGGPGSLSPSAMRGLLVRSTFDHDLDQQHSGVRDLLGLTITADGEYGVERRPALPAWTTPGSMDDTRFFTVRYSGPGSIVSLTLDGTGANPTGVGTGIVFDPRPFLGLPAAGVATGLFDQGFPFTVGAASPGIDPATVTATVAPDGRRLTVSFPPGALARGRAVSFGIDRDEAVTAYGNAQDGNSADQLGPGVVFPSGRIVGPGMGYSARTSFGLTLSGRLANVIGAGWTPVDGYGLLNAQAAVRNAGG